VKSPSPELGGAAGFGDRLGGLAWLQKPDGEDRADPEHLHTSAGIAAITASELLHGVHRATPGHRVRRQAFVEAVLAAFPPLPYGLRPALRVGRLRRDRPVLIHAAARLCHKWPVTTTYLSHAAYQLVSSACCAWASVSRLRQTICRMLSSVWTF